MGYIGLKPWAYDFLSQRYPEALTPEEIADEAMQAGVSSRSKKPRQSIATTIRRWARPGDRYQDPRFDQRYENGRIVVFAYPAGYEPASPLGKAPIEALPKAADLPATDEVNSILLADLLVEQGSFRHKVEALTALAELPLRGITVPQRLLDELEAAINQEQAARQKKQKIVSELGRLLDAHHT